MKKLQKNVVQILQDFGFNNPDYHCNDRIWTRGDGARYKDMDYFTLVDGKCEDIFAEIEKRSKRLNWINGEFPSIEKRKSAAYKGVVFILNSAMYQQSFIEIASMSVLNNSAVWVTKPRLLNVLNR